jgi:hypothetical protein
MRVGRRRIPSPRRASIWTNTRVGSSEHAGRLPQRQVRDDWRDRRLMAQSRTTLHAPPLGRALDDVSVAGRGLGRGRDGLACRLSARCDIRRRPRRVAHTGCRGFDDLRRSGCGRIGRHGGDPGEVDRLRQGGVPGAYKGLLLGQRCGTITKSAMPDAGKAKFTYDSGGRSSIARATLTYALYAASKGSRQGSTLNPPGWPSSNPEVYSHSALTGKTTHTYLWNRSHSIADSLLGALSYSSSANFTAGTKDQNVGADDNGGMRAAEETAEHYWAAHPGSKVVIWYQTTPLYSGSNMVPSGSIVDELSSDGSINKEIVVLNDEEGIAVNYSGSFV